MVVGAIAWVLLSRDAPVPERVTGPVLAESEPTYVGAAACAECHKEEAKAWSQSHHALAMQEASSSTVLGDFDSKSIEYAGLESTFFTREGAFFVRTEGPDGELTDYEVEYTFGVEPLQQYLVATEPGRFQALPVAWDTRPAGAGGQRWFHLHPNEQIRAGDALHWTAPIYNWNNACADCHSTALQKNYDRASKSYKTTYTEINVACEACHGPGSLHVSLAEAGDLDREDGFRRLPARETRQWSLASGRDIAALTSASPSDELEICAPCHSRRSDLGGRSDRFHDRYRLALLEEYLYFPDGQIRDEVFVFGSFVQSKMHAGGVVCTDCHEPHGLKLHAEGNALCGQCHSASKYDNETHHFHQTGTEGALCTSCHMPSRTYMTIDDRADHRFSAPDPLLAERIGSPDPCTGCHDDRRPRWAAKQIDKRLVARPTRELKDALWKGRTHAKSAEADLVRVVFSSMPGIVRASAITELAGIESSSIAVALQHASTDPNALVRRAVARSARVLPASQRAELVLPMLRDPFRTVRIEAASSLFGSDARGWNTADRQAFFEARQEYQDAREYMADRGGGLVDLATLAMHDADLEKARITLEEAIAVDPTFTAAYVNLADLYRALQQDAEAERVLRAGLKRAADIAAIQHALGLTLVRLGRLPEAIRSLEVAQRLRPENARFGFVYGVALFDSGRHGEAILTLEGLHERFPNDMTVLRGLIDYHRQLGHQEAVERYSAKLRQ